MMNSIISLNDMISKALECVDAERNAKTRKKSHTSKSRKQDFSRAKRHAKHCQYKQQRNEKLIHPAINRNAQRSIDEANCKLMEYILCIDDAATTRPYGLVLVSPIFNMILGLGNYQYLGIPQDGYSYDQLKVKYDNRKAEQKSTQTTYTQPSAEPQQAPNMRYQNPNAQPQQPANPQPTYQAPVQETAPQQPQQPSDTQAQ